LFGHDLFGKPLRTFPDHALARPITGSYSRFLLRDAPGFVEACDCKPREKF
jgi:hypothetical protein